MTFGGTKIAGVILAAASVAGFAGVAVAQDLGEQQAALKAQMREQNVLLDEEIEVLSAVGAELEESQARMDAVRARARELRSETQKLNRDLEIRRETVEISKAHYEEQARAAYKGDDLEGLAILLRSFLGGDEHHGSPADIQVAGILLDGQEDLEVYGDDRHALENTIRQLAQKREAYNEMLKQEQVQAENLRRQEQKLDAAIARIRSGRNEAEARLEKLKARERARIRKARAATAGSNPPRSGGDTSRVGGPSRDRTGVPQEEEDPLREAESRIAQEEIYIQPMEGLPEAKYWKLYKRAARDYGFARDWYILAAVGKIESNHGEYMGPSSAGAMGPMQFLPSTWEGSGVDGNGDGKANIMDPRDAIPAAAGYLKDGGAPEDWYAALYSYNHADWYVEEVLAVAEGYRQLAKDDRVGPYI